MSLDLQSMVKIERREEDINLRVKYCNIDLFKKDRGVIKHFIIKK